MKTILTAQNISKIYGKKGQSQYTAIENLSFSMKEGEFIGIMGPSGSGKTTLLNMVSSLDPVTEGQIIIDNTDLSKMNEDQLSDFRSQKLGFIFQDFNLLESMSVFENIALPLSLRNTAVSQIQSKVRQTAELLGIESILKKAYEALPFEFHPEEDAIASKYSLFQRQYAFASGTFFMGFFLGAAFLTMMASILMFKILSGAKSDVRRYENLRKLGVQRKLLASSISKELFLIFLFPAVPGLLHVLVGMKMFSFIILDPYYRIWVSILIFLAIYTGYYCFTVYMYRKIVLPKEY